MASAVPSVQESAVLNATQEKILAAAVPGKVLVVHRVQRAPHGCTFLAEYLESRGWEGGVGGYGPEWIKQLLHSNNDVVIDCEYCMQHHVAKTRALFKTIADTPTHKRVIVMCHGEPPALQGAILLDITHAPTLD
jgi:hypothetical protein